MLSVISSPANEAQVEGLQVEVNPQPHARINRPVTLLERSSSLVFQQEVSTNHPWREGSLSWVPSQGVHIVMLSVQSGLEPAEPNQSQGAGVSIHDEARSDHSLRDLKKQRRRPRNV